MKYIRTKDGIYKAGVVWTATKSDFNKKYYGLDEGDKFFGINNEIIKLDNKVKQADSIEELCDEFVLDHNNGTRVMQTKECKPQFPFCEDTIDYFRRNNQTFYGAIWTNKGLIYVAKMNEKGELELL